MPRFRRRPEHLIAPERARALTLQAVQRARRARRELVLLIPLIVGVLAAYRYREQLFGVDTPVRAAVAIVLVGLGWALARDLGRFLTPWLSRRLDVATAGTIGFLIRLSLLGIAMLAALRIAGLRPQTL